ncbi:MAG: hypothetical protein AB4290_20630 [Spirulina sp.]
MVKFSRRHWLQATGATLAAWGSHYGWPFQGSDRAVARQKSTFIFDPPGFQNDFLPGEMQAERLLRSRWHAELNRWTERALQNEPWNFTNQPPLTHYYNPAKTDVPEGAAIVPIAWSSYPNRIKFYYPDAGRRKHWEYADNGPPPSPDPDNYSFSGHRDWQDEYVEWSVVRNEAGKIVKVQFTSEPREYWYALWDVSPEAVLRLYRQLAGDRVELEDLYLRDEGGDPILDPQTGRPAYDEFNPWNGEGGSAVHLIAESNILQGAIFLGAQSTILRRDERGRAIADPSQLINCGLHGTPNRHSDPFISAMANDLVKGAGIRATLKNPVGLYLQEPNFRTYQLPPHAPPDAKPSDYWNVIRGRKRQGRENYDLIVHAVYEVPPELGFTVGDIAIEGFPIEYGAQLAETISVAIIVEGIPQEEPARVYRCAKKTKIPYPMVLRERPLLKIGERSHLVMKIERGTTIENVALKAEHCDRQTRIEFVGAPGVTLTKTGFQEEREEEDLFQIFILTVTAASNAPLGYRSLRLRKPDGLKSTARLGAIEVVERGSLRTPK